MYKDSKRKLFYILFVSTALHLIIITLFLLLKLNNNLNIHKKNPLADKKKKEARVIFKQAPKKPAKKIKTPKPPIKKPKPPKTKPKPKLKKLIPNFAAGNPSLRPPLVEKEKPKKQGFIPPDNKKIEPKKTKPLALPHVTKNMKPVKKTQNKKPTPLRKQDQKKVLKLKETTLLSKKIEPLPSATHKKMTLADLTKGFMEHARKDNALQQTNSNHLISITGKQKGQATAEQLKHERYIKKLFDCIDVSLKYLKRTFSFTSMPKADTLKLLCLVDLNPQGKIVKFNIVQPSGTAQFDIFMKKVFYDAARSFPPLPASFKTSIYSVPIKCHVSVAQLLQGKSHFYT
ncbi:TonB C-terminal domain-containing protein [bacterium]|nr:TonB C-terminal domain-containing protein [bacterium]